jgi:hypothetical protein
MKMIVKIIRRPNFAFIRNEVLNNRVIEILFHNKLGGKVDC